MSAPVAVTLAWGAGTDAGHRRAANEDSFVAAPPLFLVADGMGGHEAGAEASARAIAGFAGLAGRDWVSVDDVQAGFRDAVAGVGGIVTERFSAGTTLSGVFLSEQVGAPYWLVLNIGDSRTYRLIDGELQQISIDHSAVQALVELGEIDQHEAERHPQRNVVTRAIGAGSTALPDYWLFPVLAGERLLVCSDGLTKELSAEVIHRALTEEPVAQDAATRLIREALAHGGHDNVTVIVVDALPTAASAIAPPDLDECTRPRPADSEEASVARV